MVGTWFPTLKSGIMTTNKQEVGQRENIEVLTDNDSLFVWSSGLKKMVKILTSKLGFVKNKGDENIGGKKIFTESFGTPSDVKVQVGSFTQVEGGDYNAVNLKIINTSVLGGIIKVKIASSFLNRGAYGCIEKVFNLYWDGTNATFYKSNSFVSMCGEKTAAEWFIGDIAKVPGVENNEIFIPIVNRNRKNNRVTVIVEFCNYLPAVRTEVSLSDPYDYTGEIIDNRQEFFYHPGDLARLRNDMKTEYSFVCPVGEEINTNLKLNGLIQFKTNLYTGYSLLANWNLSSLPADTISAHPTIVLGSLDSAGKVCIGKKETNGNLFIVNKTTSQQTITIRAI